jgi:hypothetical protein
MIASAPDGRTAAVERRTPGRVAVVVGMLLMPLAAIVLAAASLLGPMAGPERLSCLRGH